MIRRKKAKKMKKKFRRIVNMTSTRKIQPENQILMMMWMSWTCQWIRVMLDFCAAS